MTLDPTDALRAVGRRLLVFEQHGFYWGDAIAYDGLLEADDLLDLNWAQELAHRLTRWCDTAPDSYDDSLAPGRATAQLVGRGLLGERVLERVVAALLRLPRSDGIPLLRPHVPEWRTLVWVDSLYHVPSGLIAAGQVLDDQDLVEQGVAVAAETLKVLSTDAAVGHAWDAGLQRATGVEWTRGIGWALLGLLDSCELAPEQARAAGLVGHADRLTAVLASAQRANGHWPTVLDRDDADDETSVMGFWLAADLHNAAPRAHPDVSTAALGALLGRIDDDGTVQGVSHDAHVRWSVEHYLHPTTQPSPWGQGATLRGLAACVARGGEPA